MPIYLYECALCETRHEVEKPIRFLDDVEVCPGCGAQMRRIPCRVNFTMEPWAENGEYNPGLGCVVKSKKHKRELLAKYKDQNGSELIEIGNEKVKKHIEPVEKKQKREWDETVNKCQKILRT